MMVALPFLGPDGRPVALVGNDARSVEAVLVAGGSIEGYRGRTLIARSDSPGFAEALYRAGVPLVLESRIGAGCFGTASKAGA